MRGGVEDQALLAAACLDQVGHDGEVARQAGRVDVYAQTVAGLQYRVGGGTRSTSMRTGSSAGTGSLCLWDR